MLVNFVSVSRVRESRTHGLIRGGCRKAVAYFLTDSVWDPSKTPGTNRRRPVMEARCAGPEKFVLKPG